MNLNNNQEEYWVQITDAVVPYIKPYYYISNWGRIGSMADGTFRILSLAKDSDGYLIVCLHLYLNIIDVEGHVRRQINKRINRLVIMSFYSIPENFQELEVNHINSIRDDNHLWNLEWVTPKENTLHALKYGFKEIQDIRGSKNPMAKLSEQDIYKIAELVNTGNYSCKDLCEMFNVSSSVINNIINRNSWKYLDLNIDRNNVIRNMHDINYSFNTFTKNEVEEICKFFEGNDINNIQLYPRPIDVLKDCFYTLDLDKKYDFNTKRKTLYRILMKSRKKYNTIANEYNYKFIR